MSESYNNYKIVRVKKNARYKASRKNKINFDYYINNHSNITLLNYNSDMMTDYALDKIYSIVDGVDKTQNNNIIIHIDYY